MDNVIRSMQTQLREAHSSPDFLGIITSALTRKHTKTDWCIRFATLVLPALFLGAIVFQPWVDAKWMFLDPLTAAELSSDCCHSHYGFVSTSGIILWAATASISLFAAALLFIAGTVGQLIRFPLLAGLLTGWLTLDDAFLLHETVLPAFGVPQNAVIAFYVVLAFAYFAANWKYILKYDFWVLAMGAFALSISIAVDTIFHSLDSNLVLLEDSAKFFGIFCWTSFHVTTFTKILSEKATTAKISHHG